MIWQKHPFLLLAFFFALTVLAGAFSTDYLFRSYDTRLQDLINHVQFPYFLFLPFLTLFNLILRFFRWNFLLRTFFIRIPARELFSYYFISYTGNFTPLYLLYLLRLVPVFRYKQYRGVFLFFLDLSADLFTMILFYFFHTHYKVIITLSLILTLTSLVFHYYYRKKEVFTGFYFFSGISFLFSGTILIWFFTSFVFLLAFWSFGTPFSLKEALYFLSFMNLGNLLSLLPTGTLAGQFLATELFKLGFPANITLYSLFLVKISTTWIAIGIAITALFVFRKQLFSGKIHFDTISDEYGSQIPLHVRERIIRKKILINVKYLTGLKTGLDAGCGQGWYVKEMEKEGFTVYGIDFSEKQVEKAKLYTGSGNIYRGSITQLPFPDSSFDFVYTINVLHHLPSREEQVAALREFHRVLKPEGKVIIHEINVHNPLFRFYISYLFPLIKSIDEGTEIWFHEHQIEKSRFRIKNIEYFTFLPDFLPRFLLKILEPLETILESSHFRKYSAHMAIILEKVQ